MAWREVADGSISFDHVDFSYTDENGDKTHVLKRYYAILSLVRLSVFLVERVPGKSSLVQLIPRLYDVKWSG